MLNLFWAALLVWGALPYLMLAVASVVMWAGLWWPAAIAIVLSVWWLQRRHAPHDGAQSAPT